MNRHLITLFLALSVTGLVADAAPILQGVTSKPLKNVFYPQERVILSFTVSNLEPFATGPDLDVRIVDDRERELRRLTRKVIADRHGLATVNLDDVPHGMLGFYRVYARLTDGTKLVTPWSTLRDGELTYAVVRDPKTRETADDAILRFYTTQDPDLVGPLPNRPSGAYVWTDLDRSHPGDYAANPENGKIRVGVSEGPGLYRVSPNWSEADRMRYFKWKPGHPRGYPALSSEGEKVFEDFVRTYARNLRKQGESVGYKARTYVVSGEWMHNDEGTVTVEDVLRTYEIASRAVHEEDPEGIVMGIGYDPYFWQSREYLKAGLWKHIDALSTHPYFNPDPIEPAGVVRRIRETKRLMKELSGRDIPMVSTECGYATGDRADREPVQMKHIVRLNLIFAGEGFKGLSFFVNSDYRTEPGFGYSYNCDLVRDPKGLNDFGPKKTSPKPVFPAMSAFAAFIVNTESCGDIPFLGETAWGYAYRHVPTGQIRLALWDWSGKPNDIRLKVGAAAVTVADEWGNERRMTPDAHGEIALTLGDMPTYILGVDQEIWAKPDGERVRLAEKFRREQEATRRAKGVSVGRVCPAAIGGENALEVELADLSGQPNEGELKVRVGDVVRTQAYSLKGNETKAMTVPLGRLDAHPLVETPVEVTVRMSDGRIVRRDDRVNFLVIPKATVAFDGSFAGWDKVPHTEMADARFSVGSGKPLDRGTNDFSSVVGMAWDDKGLLFHFIVRDDALAEPTAGNLCWLGDTIQIALAKAYRYEETGNTWLDLLSVSRTEHAFALTADGPYCYRHTTFDQKSMPRGPQKLGENGLDAAMVRTRLKDGAWRFESVIRIPWRCASTGTPKPGDRYAIAFALNDYDFDAPSGRHNRQHAPFPLKFPDKFGAVVIGK